MFDVNILSKATGKPVVTNMVSVAVGLNTFGLALGVTKPHILAHYLCQLAHESGGFRYDKEIWGPTPAQARYDTRTDLGNTAARDGDGKWFMGRGPIQITGLDNYRSFTQWCHKKIGPHCPDFTIQPERINEDPYEGLVPLWYWESRGLSRYAEHNDIEMVTRRINGGLNGYEDRIDWYNKMALVLLGRSPNDVRGFQKASLLTQDGISGPRTRAAMHGALRQMKAM